MAFINIPNIVQEQAAINQLIGPTQAPLDALIQGVQQGVSLQQLPQTIQNQALANRLQNALNQQKLFDLQNPNQALARKIQEELTLKGALNPDLGITRAPSGLMGETIGVPTAIPQTAIGLEQAIAANPNMVIPTAAPKLPITPIGVGDIQSGLNLNPNIPLESQQRKDDAMIRRVRAAMKGTTTKEGYYQDPVSGELRQIFIPGGEGEDLATERKATAEATAKAKADAVQAKIDSAEKLLGRKLTAQEDAQARDIEYKTNRDENNIEARQTLADKRSKLAAPGTSAYQAERQTRVLESVDELEKDVGYDTVGFADWFKGVPTSASREFAGKLKTLKAAIAFGELTAMREASKTGGALGQVSNLELGLLESALGNLDQAQSPSEFKEQLQKVRDSIQRWRTVSSELTKGGAGKGGVETTESVGNLLKSGQISQEEALKRFRSLKAK